MILPNILLHVCCWIILKEVVTLKSLLVYGNSVERKMMILIGGWLEAKHHPTWLVRKTTIRKSQVKVGVTVQIILLTANLNFWCTRTYWQFLKSNLWSTFEHRVIVCVNLLQKRVKRIVEKHASVPPRLPSLKSFIFWNLMIFL